MVGSLRLLQMESKVNALKKVGLDRLTFFTSASCKSIFCDNGDIWHLATQSVTVIWIRPELIWTGCWVCSSCSCCRTISQPWARRWKCSAGTLLTSGVRANKRLLSRRQEKWLLGESRQNRPSSWKRCLSATFHCATWDYLPSTSCIHFIFLSCEPRFLNKKHFEEHNAQQF